MSAWGIAHSEWLPLVGALWLSAVGALALAGYAGTRRERRRAGGWLTRG